VGRAVQEARAPFIAIRPSQLYAVARVTPTISRRGGGRPTFHHDPLGVSCSTDGVSLAA
jgi:hypothetical protein